MRVNIAPQYGFGWRLSDGALTEVPPPFELDVDVLAEGNPFQEAFGQVFDQAHPLVGLWVRLNQRTTGAEPTYNVHAFEDMQTIGRDRAHITGFAIVRRVT